MSSRLRLRGSDGVVYLERWGWECRWGGVFIHRMDGPDPGRSLHDHRWSFGSLVLKGAYHEYRNDTETLAGGERIESLAAWRQQLRPRWSWKSLGLNECHTITWCIPRTWTLVLHGPVRREWGFYTPNGWRHWTQYEGAGATEIGRVD